MRSLVQQNKYSPVNFIHSGFANTQNLLYFTQNCSVYSTEVTEGVTSTPEIFGNEQGATLTPEMFGNKHSFVLTFFTTNTIYVIVNIVNLN